VPAKNEKDKQLPPGQFQMRQHLRWGVDHPTIPRATVPKINLSKYTLTIEGEVEEPQILSWEDIEKLPTIKSVSDFHCVEGWSVLDNRWQGISFKDIIAIAKPKKTAKYVSFECADGYTTSLSLQELSKDNVLLATKLNGKNLEEGMGFPMRLIVPDKYGYKSAMWVTRIKFTEKKELGYWEKRGYNDTADVWKNDRLKQQDAK
jgi:DMSO/TMAO reductase YedYZ molybdopterin-dependent catalytic subunit